jgi:hypothetical protein
MVQAAQPDQARPLLLGPHSHAAPSVGQVAGGALVVSQAGAGDGGRRGGPPWSSATNSAAGKRCWRVH